MYHRHLDEHRAQKSQKRTGREYPYTEAALDEDDFVTRKESEERLEQEDHKPRFYREKLVHLVPLVRATPSLTERKKEAVLTYIRLFLEGEKPTNQKIGQCLGITKERAGQLIRSTFQKLRSAYPGFLINEPW